MGESRRRGVVDALRIHLAFAPTQHIRPKFTPAEWDLAEEDGDVAELLTLLDGPKE